jgi:hypothetical protein
MHVCGASGRTPEPQKSPGYGIPGHSDGSTACLQACDHVCAVKRVVDQLIMKTGLLVRSCTSPWAHVS